MVSGRDIEQMAHSMLKSIFRPELFAGKVAVVTGGGTGIGLAITKELALLGCKVVIASRKIERLDSATKEIREAIAGSTTPISVTADSHVVPVQCNIRNEEEVRISVELQHAKLCLFCRSSS